MQKRQLLLTHFTPAELQRLHELISFRARIDTIKALLPVKYVEGAVRLLYQVTPDASPPRGLRSPVSSLVSRTYASRSSRLALSEMYNSFDDLRKCGFSFDDSLIYVYRVYAKKNHHAVSAVASNITVVSFEHFYAIALALEAKRSNLIRCKCGARNLLTQHVSSSSLSCIFCVQKVDSKSKVDVKKVAVG